MLEFVWASLLVVSHDLHLHLQMTKIDDLCELWLRLLEKTALRGTISPRSAANVLSVDVAGVV